MKFRGSGNVALTLTRVRGKTPLSDEEIVAVLREALVHYEGRAGVLDAA